MATPPLAFTGISSFSSDFQTILTRATSIASLPLKALQNQEADGLQKKQLLISLNSGVADVGSSLAALGTLATGKALVASTSDSTVVSVQNTGAASAANYSITNITSIASAASETSATGYASTNSTPVSSDGAVNLVLGSQTFNINLTPQTNNLIGLRDAINNSGAGVTASILTTGTGANPNFLAVTANATGATTLQLNDVPTAGAPVNLLTRANQGANAVFQLNGVAVNRSTNTVNDVVSGLTFTLLKNTAPNQTVSLSLATDRSRLSSALQTFANKYNALVDQVDGQVGPAAGLLSGDFIIREVENDLRQVTGFQGSGDIRSLANLGLSLDATGKISLDQNAFNGLTDSQVSAAFTFLGSSSTGLGSLAQKFTQLSDPALGLIRVEEDGLDQTDSALKGKISNVQDRITRLQASVNTRLQQADALLANLESEQKTLTASIQSVDLALFGKPASQTGQ
jgi:flagellar hook-associated protein 2